MFLALSDGTIIDSTTWIDSNEGFNRCLACITISSDLSWFSFRLSCGIQLLKLESWIEGYLERLLVLHEHDKFQWPVPFHLWEFLLWYLRDINWFSLLKITACNVFLWSPWGCPVLISWLVSDSVYPVGWHCSAFSFC